MLSGLSVSLCIPYAQRLLALRKLIVERQPDVVISFMSGVNVAAILASAFLRTPTIICQRIDPSGYPLPKLWKIACQLTYRYADMLTVQTDTVAEKIYAIFP